jgi:nucleoside-diphosphate-sugar epimerase
VPPITKGQTVCIFGAGGPVAAVCYPLLSEHYTLRLADLQPVEDLLAKPPGPVPGWPRWTRPPKAKDSWIQADITDPADVRQALQGCDAAINLTVNRSDAALAFGVNAIGTYHLLSAARDLGLARVIQTGMLSATGYGYEGDVKYDFELVEGSPQRPGTHLYGLTKHLGLQTATIFAQRHDMDVMTILFHRLRPHDRLDGRDDNIMIPYATAWDDLPSLLRAALKAPTMPTPNEVFHVTASMPMDKYRPDKARRLLGWQARHTFEHFYTRDN